MATTDLNAALLGMREITKEKLLPLILESSQELMETQRLKEVKRSPDSLYVEIVVKEEIYPQADNELKALHGKQ